MCVNQPLMASIKKKHLYFIHTIKAAVTTKVNEMQRHCKALNCRSYQSQ